MCKLQSVSVCYERHKQWKNQRKKKPANKIKWMKSAFPWPEMYNVHIYLDSMLCAKCSCAFLVFTRHSRFHTINVEKFNCIDFWKNNESFENQTKAKVCNNIKNEEDEIDAQMRIVNKCINGHLYVKSPTK